MTRWQPREAAWRAVKTFLQTFFGALTGVTIATPADAQQSLLTATWAAFIAAGMAFAMNLETPAPEEPIRVTVEEQ